MRFCAAILVSVALHGVLALALILCLEFAPGPEVLASLDLSSVELSFAEQEQETTASFTPPPASDVRPQVPRPAPERPPEVRPDRVLPPDPSAPRLPEPEEPKPEVEPWREQVADRPPDDPRPAPRQARIDAPPRPRRSIRPDYPKGARQRGEQGSVVLEIRVNEKGAVDDVSVVGSSGFAELDAAAVSAAKAARFSPARSGRDAVASVARLTLTFRLK